MVLHKLMANGDTQKYKDLELDRVIEAGEEVDITLKRAKYVNDYLADYEMVWERVEEEPAE